MVQSIFLGSLLQKKVQVPQMLRAAGPLSQRSWLCAGLGFRHTCPAVSSSVELIC